MQTKIDKYLNVFFQWISKKFIDIKTWFLKIFGIIFNWFVRRAEDRKQKLGALFRIKRYIHRILILIEYVLEVDRGGGYLGLILATSFWSNIYFGTEFWFGYLDAHRDLCWDIKNDPIIPLKVLHISLAYSFLPLFVIKETAGIILYIWYLFNLFDDTMGIVLRKYIKPRSFWTYGAKFFFFKIYRKIYRCLKIFRK
uniref:Orf196 n=1 Tax=Ochromonas danica TaxID=2986 RepID=Q9G909_OCHDN|nr:orf196 [Ochromonas danica]AAG18396.1 orf196 [Ochromonas danica]